MKRLLFVCLLPLLLLGGCKSLDPTLPKGYTGPVFTLTDSVLQDSAKQGQVFCVDEIDGKPTENALLETQRATAAQDGRLVMWSKTRQLPAQPVKLRLLGTQVFASVLMGAPLRELQVRVEGRFLSVAGEIEFTPAPGAHYLVTGELKPDGGSRVWLMDAETQVPVSTVVTESPGVLPRLLPTLPGSAINPQPGTLNQPMLR